MGTILQVEHKIVDGFNRIQNLEVKSINGIDWNDFFSSVYLKDSPKPIEGTTRHSICFRIVKNENCINPRRQFDHLKRQPHQTFRGRDCK